jgi:hypothetical protein
MTYKIKKILVLINQSFNELYDDHANTNTIKFDIHMLIKGSNTMAIIVFCMSCTILKHNIDGVIIQKVKSTLLPLFLNYYRC